MIWCILLLGIFFRSKGLSQSLWLDEAAQVIESARPLAQQLDIAGDFWPPLYHLILHFWMYIGTSEVWLRLLSVIIGALTIYLTYRLVDQFTSKKIAVVTAFLLAISPFHIWYSQEIRPYALSVLMAVWSTYYLLKKNRLGFVIATIGFLFTSYLSVFLIAAQGVYVYIFQKKEKIAWFKSMRVVLLSFIPWLPYFWRQLTIGSGLTNDLPGWSTAVSTPIEKSVPLIFAKFVFGRVTFDDKTIYALLVLGLAVFCGILLYKAFVTYKRLTTTLLTFAVFPVGLCFVISIFLPILAPQRVLFILPFFYTLLALGMMSLKKQKSTQIIALGVFVVISFYTQYQYLSNSRFQREHWREAVKFVENDASSRSVAVFVFPDAFAPWQWYSQDKVSAIAVAPHLVVTERDLEDKKIRLDSADKIYYFHYLTDLTDPEKRVTNYLNELGFYEIKAQDFPGVGIISTYEKYLASR